MEDRTTERQDARRQKRKKAKQIRKLKLIALAVGFVVMIALLITLLVHLYQRWDARFDSNTSVIFIQENGQVVSNDVIAFDTNKYSQTELETFISETIATYNEENGEKAVVQKSLKVEEGIASLILIYQDMATYCDFSGAEVFVGTINEAASAGYTFEGQFAGIVDGKATACDKSAFLGQDELTVVIIKANTKISVYGEIQYVSVENVSEVGANWIITKEGEFLLEQPAPETGTDDIPESETSDGSVDGTELETEEEETSTEIIFDFGDQEIAEDEEIYSEVYTYIIFK